MITAYYIQTPDTSLCSQHGWDVTVVNDVYHRDYFNTLPMNNVSSFWLVSDVVEATELSGNIRVGSYGLVLL